MKEKEEKMAELECKETTTGRKGCWEREKKLQLMSINKRSERNFESWSSKKG